MLVCQGCGICAAALTVCGVLGIMIANMFITEQEETETVRGCLTVNLSVL